MPDFREDYTHAAFGDETNYNSGHFPGLGVVSLAQDRIELANQTLRGFLAESNITEFKWAKLRTASMRFLALKFVDYAIQEANAENLRIDVLTWDISDSRHNIRKPDKIDNLQRMYYHLFRNVLRKRWPDNAIWCLFPDEHSALDWRMVRVYLQMSRGLTNRERRAKNIPGKRIPGEGDFFLEGVFQCRSHEEPLIQLADLFVGLGAFSREFYGKYEIWESSQIGDEDSNNNLQLSHSEREKCLILNHLNTVCKKNKMWVSLKTHRGLKTVNPRMPLNFWWYKPQSLRDKAPARERK